MEDKQGHQRQTMVAFFQVPLPAVNLNLSLASCRHPTDPGVFFFFPRFVIVLLFLGVACDP